MVRAEMKTTMRRIIKVGGVGLVLAGHANHAAPALAQTNAPPCVIRSFYELPEKITVVKAFRSDVPCSLGEQGITLTDGSDKPTGQDYRCNIASDQLHGTAAAPFSGTAFMVQPPDGLRMAFRKPQQIVAMTIAGPTTKMEVTHLR